MFFRSCQQCNKLTMQANSNWVGLCEGCSQNQVAGKRFVNNVTLVKLEKRMPNEKPVGKPNDQVGSYDQSPYSPASRAGVKDDQGKLMWNLLPWKAVEGMVKVLTFGAKKYTPNGWRSVPNAKDRYTAAMLRHVAAMQSGQVNDPESGLRHIDHVLTNAAFLAELGDG